MTESMNDILHPGQVRDPDFPYAPQDWDEEVAARIANADDLVLDAGHWAVIQFLQEYCGTREERDKDLHHMARALDARFEKRGGNRYLYGLFPGGPIHQGCRIAGLEPPEGSADASFGSTA